MRTVLDGEVRVIAGNSWNEDGIYIVFGPEYGDIEDMMRFSISDLVRGSELYEFYIRDDCLVVTVVREFVPLEGGYYRRLPDDKVYTYVFSITKTDIILGLALMISKYDSKEAFDEVRIFGSSEEE